MHIQSYRGWSGTRMYHNRLRCVNIPRTILGMIGASFALSTSNIPWNGPLGAIRVTRNPSADSGQAKKFDLSDPASRKEYFEYKCGPEIKKLREYLKKNTFIAYFMGKKSSGKGTYSKMFAEVIDKDKIAHFSIGDMIRSFDEVIQDKEKKRQIEVKDKK